MRKICLLIAVIFCAVYLLSLTACGGSKPASSNPPPTQQTLFSGITVVGGGPIVPGATASISGAVMGTAPGKLNFGGLNGTTVLALTWGDTSATVLIPEFKPGQQDDSVSLTTASDVTAKYNGTFPIEYFKFNGTSLTPLLNAITDLSRYFTCHGISGTVNASISPTSGDMFIQPPAVLASTQAAAGCSIQLTAGNALPSDQTSAYNLSVSVPGLPVAKTQLFVSIPSVIDPGLQMFFSNDPTKQGNGQTVCGNISPIRMDTLFALPVAIDDNFDGQSGHPQGGTGAIGFPVTWPGTNHGCVGSNQGEADTNWDSSTHVHEFVSFSGTLDPGDWSWTLENFPSVDNNGSGGGTLVCKDSEMHVVNCGQQAFTPSGKLILASLPDGYALNTVDNGGNTVSSVPLSSLPKGFEPVDVQSDASGNAYTLLHNIQDTKDFVRGVKKVIEYKMYSVSTGEASASISNVLSVLVDPSGKYYALVAGGRLFAYNNGDWHSIASLPSELAVAAMSWMPSSGEIFLWAPDQQPVAFYNVATGVVTTKSYVKGIRVANNGFAGSTNGDLIRLPDGKVVGHVEPSDLGSLSVKDGVATMQPISNGKTKQVAKVVKLTVN